MTDSKTPIPLEKLRFPVSYLLLVRGICEYEGRDFARLLEQEFGLQESVLNDPHHLIDGHMMRLILDAIEVFIARDPKAQFYLMEQFPLSIHGYVGLAAMTSDTLREATDIGIRYFGQVMPAYEVTIKEVENYNVLYLRALSDFGERNELFTETIACALASVIKFTNLCYANIICEFTHEKLVLSELSNIFPDVMVNMGCRENRFLIPLEYLDTPLFTGNETTQKMLAQILEDKQKALDHDKTLSSKISQLIHERLEESLPSTLEDVCKSLQISQRTLSRRLQEEGTNFKSLHSDCRLQQAIQLWRSNPKLSSAAIAESLGFSNEASLSRFIKQQTGLSPSELRKRPS